MNRSDSDAAAMLLPMITGHVVSRLIYAATVAGVVDALGEEEKKYDAIAQATHSDGEALLRLLRALVTVGLAREPTPGRFCAAPQAAPLRSNSTNSLRNLVLMHGAERSWRSWEHMPYSLRTGRPASNELYGTSGFDYFEHNADAAAVFHAAMAEVSASMASAIVAAYDFSQHASIADIGGGDGMLLSRVLAAAPNARGTLFDLPHALRRAEQRLAAAGQQDRCDIVAGDFFEAIPPGRHAYLLKNILHDWDDERCLAILGTLRRAMAPESQAFVIERIVPPQIEARPEHRQVAMMDLGMLVIAGGRERTQAQFGALLQRTSLRMLGEPIRLGGAFPCAMLRIQRSA